jgi:hypothetical protein
VWGRDPWLCTRLVRDVSPELLDPAFVSGPIVLPLLREEALPHRSRRHPYVFVPDARRAQATLVTVIPMPEDPTNCTFGGLRRDTLYVTTTSSLYRIRTGVRGQASPPGK